LPIDKRDLLTNSPAFEAKLAAGASAMTLRELCAAIVTQSDNSAANILLAAIGGPPALNRFFRDSVGDKVTRFDRNEYALNSNVAGDPRDTTTPRAMVDSMLRLFTQDVLSLPSRALLIDWMTASRTGLDRVRAGIPRGWQAGDKTGTGENGAVNDLAVAYPPGRRPIFVAVYMSESKLATAELAAAHAEIGRLVAEEKWP
jgi:beta-lactamase class A